MASKFLVVGASIFAVLSSAVSAEAANWAVEYIKARQAVQVAHTLGDDAAQDYLKPDTAEGRIVGGTIAPTNKWPAQVGLLLANYANNFQAQYCGGTLVHERFIVTAAHCSDFVNEGQVHVLTGTQSLLNGGTRHAVRRIVIHPNWNPRTFNADIAVWELQNAVTGITPARMIASPRQERDSADPGSSAIATGWGAILENGSQSSALRQVTVPIIDTGTCNRRSSYVGSVTSNMLCAGRMAGGRDTCQGDSGGPLWVKDSNGQFKLLAGITSWGNGCARRDYPGVYTRLGALGDWARQTIARFD